MSPKYLAAAALLVVGCSKAPETPDPDAGGVSDMAQSDAGDHVVDSDVIADDGSVPDADMLADCSPVFLGPDDDPFDTLAEYCLFSDPVAQTPADGVLPFEPIAVLYADESLKARFVAVPDGESIEFDPMERWTYPVGTTLVKTFYYYDDATNPAAGRRLLETRLLVNRGDEWDSFIYVWNEEQTEASYERLGDWIEFDRVDEEGATVATRYRVPNQNQCGSCHEQNDVSVPLGPRGFQLHSDLDFGGAIGMRNQLEYWAELGILSGVPDDLSGQFALTDFTDDTADIEGRARSYLEVNCAHCHSDGGAADSSGLRLGVNVDVPLNYGVCRRPVAAGGGSGGFFYDIVPRNPDESIMVFRMESVDPEIKMPELPTQTSDDLGVRIVRDWISAMTLPDCPDP